MKKGVGKKNKTKLDCLTRERERERDEKFWYSWRERKDRESKVGLGDSSLSSCHTLEKKNNGRCMMMGARVGSREEKGKGIEKNYTYIYQGHKNWVVCHKPMTDF